MQAQARQQLLGKRGGLKHSPDLLLSSWDLTLVAAREIINRNQHRERWECQVQRRAAPRESSKSGLKGTVGWLCSILFYIFCEEFFKLLIPVPGVYTLPSYSTILVHLQGMNTLETGTASEFLLISLLELVVS